MNLREKRVKNNDVRVWKDIAVIIHRKIKNLPEDMPESDDSSDEIISEKGMKESIFSNLSNSVC